MLLRALTNARDSPALSCSDPFIRTLRSHLNMFARSFLSTLLTRVVSPMPFCYLPSSRIRIFRCTMPWCENMSTSQLSFLSFSSCALIPQCFKLRETMIFSHTYTPSHPLLLSLSPLSSLSLHHFFAILSLHLSFHYLFTRSRSLVATFLHHANFDVYVLPVTHAVLSAHF